MKGIIMTYDEFEYYVSRSFSIHQTWKIDGMTGGNCWGDDANLRVEAEDTPDNIIGDILVWLEVDVPFSIGYEMMKDHSLFKEYDKTESEYYGNYYVIRHREYDLKAIYDYIKEYL